MQTLNFRRRMFLGFCLFVSVIAMLASFIPAGQKAWGIVVQLGEERGKNQFAKIPDYSYETISGLGEYYASGKALKTPQSITDFVEAEKTVSDYNIIIDKALKQRYMQMTGFNQGDYTPYHISNSKDVINKEWSKYQTAYVGRWSAEELNTARANYRPASGYERIFWREPAKSWSETMSFYASLFLPLLGLLLAGYCGAAICSNIYFIPVLRSLSYSWKQILWGELFSFNLLAANITFPIMLPVFPWGNPKDHMEQAMRRVTTVISLLFMHIGAAATTSYAQNRQTPVEGHEIVKVDDPARAITPLPLPTVMPTPSPTHTPQTKGYGVSVETVTRSKYVGLNGAEFYPGLVQQTQITINAPNGIYFGVWNSKSIGVSPSGSENFGNETDWFLGWSGTKRHLNFDVGGSLVNVSPLRRISGDVLQMYGRVGRDFQITPHNSLEPYVMLRHFEPVNGKAPASGTFLETGAKHIYENGHLSISEYGETLFGNGAFGFDTAVMFRAGGEATWAINRKFKLLGTAQFSMPLSHVTDGRKPECVYGFGARINF